MPTTIKDQAQEGAFKPTVPGSEPLTTKGHAPGVLVGNDAKPEFHAETYPAGTAPAENSFTPQANDVPGQAFNENATATTSASASLGGATSADVHAGMGKPGAGMTSQELHGGHRKKERSGLEGVGANISDPIRAQQADIAHEPGTRGKAANPESIPGAEERIPEPAETLDAERK